MFHQLEPIESSDLFESEIIAPPTTSSSGIPRKRRCTPAVRAFMCNALRELEKSEQPTPTIEVPAKSFERLCLKNPYQIVSALDSCPESEYIKIEAEDDKIILVKVGEPETRTVTRYDPRYHQED